MNDPSREPNAPKTERPPTPALPLRFLVFFRAPWMWLGFSGLVLVLDFFFGPVVHLSMLFVFPVAAAAWHRGLKYGLPLAVVLPCSVLLFHFAWDVSWSWGESASNCGIRVAALVLFAVILAQLRRQADEIRTLRGILPICAHCKKIRDGDGAWQPIEAYISSATDTRFSHGICPECLKQFYGKPLGASAAPTETRANPR